MGTININAAPCYSMHRHEWMSPEAPDLPEGPIELYSPAESGTEDLEPDANFVSEFYGEYPDMMSAIQAITGELGRFMWSQPASGKYLGFLNHCQGSVAVVIY